MAVVADCKGNLTVQICLDSRRPTTSSITTHVKLRSEVVSVFVSISANHKIGLGSSIGKSGAVAEAKHTILSDLAELLPSRRAFGIVLRQGLTCSYGIHKTGDLHEV